jgi:hypothetical protein
MIDNYKWKPAMTIGSNAEEIHRTDKPRINLQTQDSKKMSQRLFATPTGGGVTLLILIAGLNQTGN